MEDGVETVVLIVAREDVPGRGTLVEEAYVDPGRRYDLRRRLREGGGAFEGACLSDFILRVTTDLIFGSGDDEVSCCDDDATEGGKVMAECLLLGGESRLLESRFSLEAVEVRPA